MPKIKKKSKPRFKLIYKGTSWKEAELATSDFWKEITPAEKLSAITNVIYESYLLKGIDFHALRFLRTTALIRKA